MVCGLPSEFAFALLPFCPFALLPFCPFAPISHHVLASNFAVAFAHNVAKITTLRASARATKLVGKTLWEMEAKGQKVKWAKGQK